MILRLFFDIAYASINENAVIGVHNTAYWHKIHNIYNECITLLASLRSTDDNKHF